MSESSQEQVIALVNSLFRVLEFNKGLYSLEFKIGDSEFKETFEELARKLESMNYICKMELLEGDRYIVVQKFPERKTRKWLSSSWIPRILFVVVIGFVMIDGYYRTIGTNSIVEIGEPLEMAGVYTLSLLGILGVHELGHIVAAKIHKLKTSWPYFIPGIPIFGIPTFGAFIQSRGLTINREILFDVAIAGPIAGLVIAILVAMYGAYSAPVLETQLADQMFEEGRLSEFAFGEPLFLKWSIEVFGNDTANKEIILTPVLWAAWIGFFITFLNLMPAWQLDGGHLIRTVLGARMHKVTTYTSFIILALIGFEFAALIFYFWSRGQFSAQPLDDLSPLSKKRKVLYLGVIGLAILCMPFPENICMPFMRSLCIF
ncbi:MAG: site-2 protease family protein [Nitrosarchaeum sp.]|nr:site-2 protease family protein [Nitrosarchaeum sp.]MCA9819374.1 site-2 protease family protein [Nitrosarchaeum sp.]